MAFTVVEHIKIDFAYRVTILERPHFLGQLIGQLIPGASTERWKRYYTRRDVYVIGYRSCYWGEGHRNGPFKTLEEARADADRIIEDYNQNGRGY